MSSQSIARHRAETQSLGTIAKAVSTNAGSMGLQAAVIAAASGMVLTTGIPSTAGATVDRDASAASELQVQTVADTRISAPEKAEVSFDRPDVRSVAPESSGSAEPEPVVDPRVNQAETVSEAAAVSGQQAPLQQQAQSPQPASNTAGQQATSRTRTQAQPQAQGEAQPQAQGEAQPQGQGEAQPQGGSQAREQSTSNQQPAGSSGSVSAGIASAARAQLGVTQDCTMLVTNALAAVGIDHHGWPDSYFSLGTQVSAGQARPGDLVYYADGGTGMAHIAVYVGSGQAVHGGWEGGQTVLASVNVGSGPVYIRVNG
ncbi:NlpC/P60 family protein [Arthrobacter castelli]|uniref:NlpC/P60 family protein n=1 Tax=Arthrobacter castelli TaxID=271431 RepID=UPI00040BB7B6|nr:NlpC/P60 family protein [Arthrobacter castelli]